MPDIPGYAIQPRMVLSWCDLSRRVLHAEKVNRSTAEMYRLRAETAADLLDAERMAYRADAYAEVVRWFAQIEAAWPAPTQTKH